MALRKCPDCGKMVSDRAKACPECGCPSEFFEVENQSESVQIEEVTVEGSQQAVTESAEIEYLDSFNILGVEFSYPLNAEQYISSVRSHNSEAIISERKFEKMYIDVKEMDKVWDEVIPAAQYVIDRVVKENVGILYNADIYLSEEEFVRKYKIDIFLHIDGISDEYDRIIAAANNLRDARKYERANRSHWQGGGFGVKGAIKGAITAGAMNAVTNAGRAIGDSVVNSSDNMEIYKAKQAIYNRSSTRKNILYSFRICIAKADIGLAEELYSRKLTDKININYSEAMQKYAAAIKHETDKKKLGIKAMEALVVYPLEKRLYDSALSGVMEDGATDIDELLRFMKFWEMDEQYKEIFEDARKKKIVERYFEDNPEVKDINFKTFDPENYVRLKEIRNDLLDAVGEGTLPKIVAWCQELEKYFEICLEKEHSLASTEVLGIINHEEEEFDNFINSIHREKKILPGLLKNVWIRGDGEAIPEDKIKAKWKLPLADTVYVYQNSAIFGTAFGGKGFVLTNSVICDLETKVIIVLKKVLEKRYDNEKKKICLSDGINEIIIDVSSEKPASRRFLYACIEEIVNTYASRELTEEEKHDIAVEKTVNRICEIIETYCKETGIEDSDSVIRKFYVERGLINEKAATIFCPYCGKQILRDAKFCNFCGQANGYGKNKED